MTWWWRLAALLVLLGILLSPSRAATATVPMLIASVANPASTATTEVRQPAPVQQWAGDAVRREAAAAPEYVYGSVLVAYADAPNLLGTRATYGGQGYDCSLELTERREPAAGAVYGGPAPVPAAEGVGAASGTVSRLGGDAYEILDGVRRAKAAAELGQETIAAEVQIGGRTVASGQFPVSSLLSPKSVIDVSTPSALQRWLSILNGTQAGDTLPPIIIQPGTTGVPITGVGFGF